MRNVTNADSYLDFDLIPIGYEDGPIGFQVVSDSGQSIPQSIYVMKTMNGGGSQWLRTGTQTKYLERVDKRFNLTKGVYTIQAVKIARHGPAPTFGKNRPIFNWSLFANVEVKSAPVTIKIE